MFAPRRFAPIGASHEARQRGAARWWENLGLLGGTKFLVNPNRAWTLLAQRRQENRSVPSRTIDRSPNRSSSARLPVGGPASSGTSCFVARHLNPHRWAVAEEQQPHVYCLGKCSPRQPLPMTTANDWELRSTRAKECAGPLRTRWRSRHYTRFSGYRTLESCADVHSRP